MLIDVISSICRTEGSTSNDEMSTNFTTFVFFAFWCNALTELALKLCLSINQPPNFEER